MEENAFLDFIMLYTLPVLMVIAIILLFGGFCIYIYDEFFKKEPVPEVVENYTVDDRRLFDILDKIIDVEYENIFHTKLMLRMVNSLYPNGKYNKNARVNITNEDILESCDIIEKNVIESLSPQLLKQFSAIFDKDNRSLETYVYTKVYNRMLSYTLNQKLPNVDGN